MLKNVEMNSDFKEITIEAELRKILKSANSLKSSVLIDYCCLYLDETG